MSRTRRRTRQLILLVLTVLIGVVMPAAPAHATQCGCGMGSASLTIKPYSYNSQWQGPLDLARANWTATPTPVYVNVSSSSKSYLTATSYSDTWYGLYTHHTPWLSSEYFDIKLNSRTMSADAGNFSHWVTSCFVHELGHALNQDDDPPVAWNQSIMRHDRDRDTMTTPQQYDIDGVNAHY